MADIAILVVEEYERSVKELKKKARGSEGGQAIDVVSRVSVLAQRVKRFGAEKTHHVLEPQSQVGLAASTSFFSA